MTDAGREPEPDGGETAPPAEDPVGVFEGDRDLRSGTDSCYKCSSCDTSCPVAAVDDEFPGPKFQGPEQWRLRRQGGGADGGAGDGGERSGAGEGADAIDPSVMKCSNCFRCAGACPTDVPLTEMHNVARAAHVASSMSRLSVTYWRNRLLANYGLVARVASRVPRLANALAGSRLLRRVGEAVLGVTAEREPPAFATEPFREWFERRGGPRHEDPEKRVAYFHGDFANHNSPAVGKALVRTFEAFGYEVRVPEQRCSGTPMFANGFLGDARRAARVNVDSLADAIADGCAVVCSCTSCSMALRVEYPELFDLEGVEEVAQNTWDAVEYLRVNEDLSGALADAEGRGPDLAYHAPCHARTQGLGGQTTAVLGDLDGVEATDVGDGCSGVSGTYGFKAENYDTSMAVGREMAEGMAAADAETGLTECPTCAMGMEHATGYEVRHTLEVLADALAE